MRNPNVSKLEPGDLPALMEGNLDLILDPVLAVESRRAIDEILSARGV